MFRTLYSGIFKSTIFQDRSNPKPGGKRKGEPRRKEKEGRGKHQGWVATGLNDRKEIVRILPFGCAGPVIEGGRGKRMTGRNLV